MSFSECPSAYTTWCAIAGFLIKNISVVGETKASIYILLDITIQMLNLKNGGRKIHFHHFGVILP